MAREAQDFASGLLTGCNLYSDNGLLTGCNLYSDNGITVPGKSRAKPRV